MFELFLSWRISAAKVLSKRLVCACLQHEMTEQDHSVTVEQLWKVRFTWNFFIFVNSLVSSCLNCVFAAFSATFQLKHLFFLLLFRFCSLLSVILIFKKNCKNVFRVWKMFARWAWQRPLEFQISAQSRLRGLWKLQQYQSITARWPAVSQIGLFLPLIHLIQSLIADLKQYEFQINWTSTKLPKN